MVALLYHLLVTVFQCSVCATNGLTLYDNDSYKYNTPRESSGLLALLKTKIAIGIINQRL